MRSLILSLFLIFTLDTAAIADTKSDIKEFNEAFKAYKTELKNGRYPKAIPHAKKAYELAGKVKPKDSEFYAVITYNYAELIAKKANYDKYARKIVEKSHSLYLELYGHESEKIINTLMLMGKANLNRKRIGSARGYYRNAALLADKHWGEDNFQTGIIYLETGSSLLNIASSPLSLRYLKKAKKIFVKNGSPINVAKANFWIGKYNLAVNKNKAATKYLNASLDTFKSISPNAQLTLTNHAFLVQAYEKRGKSDEATKHCRAIGKMRPNKANKEWQPVYKHLPEYPRGAARSGKQGSVTVSVTIDENGFAKDPKYIDGDKIFLKSALKAVSKFRYAPEYKDGKAIATHGIKYKFNYGFR